MEVDTSSATTWRVVNIIKEECIKTGNPVEEALICCVLKMIYDNPKNGFDSDLPMDRHAVRRLIGKRFLFCKKNLILTFFSQIAKCHKVLFQSIFKKDLQFSRPSGMGGNL